MQTTTINKQHGNYYKRKHKSYKTAQHYQHQYPNKTTNNQNTKQQKQTSPNLTTKPTKTAHLNTNQISSTHKQNKANKSQ